MLFLKVFHVATSAVESILMSFDWETTFYFCSSPANEPNCLECILPADRNFKGPFYTLGHVRYRLKRDTGVLERGLGSVGDGTVKVWFLKSQ